MKIYIINGPKGIGKTYFSVKLAERLAHNKKVLLLSTKRNLKSNIEDYFNKDGMITYDIADYFSELAPLSLVVVHERDNLDFIISPLLEDKYTFSEDDFLRLIHDVNYDYIIMDNVDKNLLEDKITIDILSSDNLPQSIDSTMFFINKAEDKIDIREYKEKIDNMGAKYIGLVKDNESFTPIIENLLSEKVVEVPKIGFFERLRTSLRR